MQTENLIFTDWLARCSSLGKIMTNLPSEEDTLKIAKEIKDLTNERDYGVNANGNKVKWTENKDNRLALLLEKQNKGDELPTGAITYLEEVFRSEFWKRKRFLENKYLSKGTICEEDALDIVSQRDNYFYRKNDEHLNNDFIQGTPDNLQLRIKDTKTSWDLESFEKAELTTLYEWQLKGYSWIAHSYDLPELETKTESELDYCLVNAPLQLLEDEKRKMWLNLGQPEEEDEAFIEKMMQLERNMIFDIAKFKQEYPHYDFYSPILDFSIPPFMRIKSFNVTLTEDDIKHMTRRVTMARKWLVDKEKETLKQLANGWNN
ncbi:hypothetical protein AV926_14165 [Myroides marinus]|uniref:Uncharacterized protein n=1 Tax=Myroides marinus TaxID=703342 RepID=A0A165R043_9FLAO|nr:hypothetical protein [Myroides marinus]KZE77514.1 hypothetical protein AV926_14165 [Myroides marinus]